MNEPSKLEYIKARLQQDFAVDRADTDFLQHYLHVNLAELRKALPAEVRRQNWVDLAWAAAVINAVGVNLELDELQQAGEMLNACVQEQNQEKTARLLIKIDQLLADILG